MFQLGLLLFRLIGWTLAFVIVAAVVLRLFFLDLAVVGHNAMAPTLVAGDEVLVWRRGEIEVGDVVVCPYPSRAYDFVVGRVAGKRGDKVAIEEGTLSINGRPALKQRRGSMRFGDPLLRREETMTYSVEQLGSKEHGVFERVRSHASMPPREIAQGIFLLSDNRQHPGQDSRSFGEVDPSSCLGKVVLRLVPGERAKGGLPRSYLDPID